MCWVWVGGRGDDDDEMETDGGESAAKQASALEVTLNCNAALAYLKAKLWAEAAQKSTAALKKEPVRREGSRQAEGG